MVDLGSESVGYLVVITGSEYLKKSKMTTDPRIQSILARLMAMPPDQIDAMLPTQQVPPTPPGTSVTGPVGAPILSSPNTNALMTLLNDAVRATDGHVAIYQIIYRIG